MSHPDESSDSWFLPYDGPIEHPFAQVPQERIPRKDHSRSRSRSRDTKRKSQRSYVALDAGGGVGGCPDGDKWGKEAPVFADHPFRMHTASVAPMRNRTMTYQPGMVSSFGSMAETRVGYRQSGAFVPLDDREREKIRPTILPPSLSQRDLKDISHRDTPQRDTQRDTQKGLYPGQYDLGTHPYAAGQMRETRFGSTSAAPACKPPVPPRSVGLRLKSSLKASISTPELRIRVPHPTPDFDAPIPRPTRSRPDSAAGPTATFEARSICDALMFARPRFRVASHELTPPLTPKLDDDGRRPSIVVGSAGLKGLACFPRSRSSRPPEARPAKEKEKQREKERDFRTVEEVLRDGAQLDRERQQWNALGQGSLLNNRARSLSRSHSRAGGARVGAGTRPRGGSVSDSGGRGSVRVWGTLKIKRSFDILAATALLPGPASVSSSRRQHGTHPSISTTSHVRGASGSAASRAHSRTESWGQRVLCRSRSASLLADDTTAEVPRRLEDYPVVDIRPVPVGNTNRARAPPQSNASTFSLPAPRGPSASPVKMYKLSVGSSNMLMGSPSPSESAIGLALSSPSGTTTPLVLPNHPFAQRAGAYPADLALGPPPGPETIATRHRHPPRGSGSTERARLDESIPRSAPLPISLSRVEVPAGPKSAPQSDHPFVVRPALANTSLGEMQRMFESAMLRSAGQSQSQPGPEYQVTPRRGSGDSGLGSSVHDYAASLGFVQRSSMFGLDSSNDPPRTTSPNAAPSPGKSACVQSPPISMDTLSPSLRPLTELSRTSSGMIDPALAGTASSPVLSRSHESSSSSFSSPRPLNSIDDIESLRDIFYRPSPVPRVASLAHNDSPRLDEEEEEEQEQSGEVDESEREDWTFGHRPFELQRDSHLLWERRDEGHDKTPLTPLVINLAPGTPSPPPSHAHDVPESVHEHDSDTQSERSVMTTSSQRVTTENVTFGVVPSTQMDTLSVNIASQRQSTALSLIDMYEYDQAISSGVPPPIHSDLLTRLTHTVGSDQYPRESFYTAASSAVQPSMHNSVSSIPVPPVDPPSVSATVLSSYFVDNHSSPRRKSDEQ